jgi:SAM-dependent methyltransferase
MYLVTPGVSTQVEADALSALLVPVDKDPFQNAIRRLRNMFAIYANNCPVPLPSPGLIITGEIRNQCELYLPIDRISAIFSRLYAAALTYPPLLSSTPFHNSMSWADSFAALSAQFQISANPGRFLEALLSDSDLLTRFLFASFLPRRFYGGIGRYPSQRYFIDNWIKSRRSGTMHCLDAACGTGEDSYGLALQLSEGGFSPDRIRIDGWTLEPLEVWAAAHRTLPHDLRREFVLREATDSLLQRGYGRSINFSCVDLARIPLYPVEVVGAGQFDLILCNGLLGGPILHEKEQLERAIGNLTNVLAPGGLLLAADHFHGGWKQKCPQNELRALFETNHLKTFEAGEGIGGLKLDQ